jgi:hypothetical protein
MTASQALTIVCAQARDDELATAEQLLRLLRRYDLRRWRFTSTIQIERGVIPHSHPVLTLNARHMDDDGLLLATYLHEQLHWFVEAVAARVNEAITELRQRYPHPPIGYPEGASDAYSSYVHYVICYLEWRALVELAGSEEAERILTFWRGDHYRGIYAAVMDDTQAIGEIVTRWLTLP